MKVDAERIPWETPVSAENLEASTRDFRVFSLRLKIPEESCKSPENIKEVESRQNSENLLRNFI